MTKRNKINGDLLLEDTLVNILHSGHRSEWSVESISYNEQEHDIIHQLNTGYSSLTYYRSISEKRIKDAGQDFISISDYW